MENLKIDDDINNEVSICSEDHDESNEIASNDNKNSLWQTPICNPDIGIVHDITTTRESINMFALDNDKRYKDLDRCIDASRENDLCSIADLIRG